jgi:hypothetical protein
MSDVSNMKPHSFDEIHEAKACKAFPDRFELLWMRLALLASFGLIVLICLR